MKRILITGGNGQLGSELAALNKITNQFHLYCTDADQLDITNRQAVMDFFAENPVDWCINAAAYTAVDKAEEEEALANAVNCDGPKNLAEACAQHGAKMVHISTDYVYHTDQNTPYVETDPTDPKGVYARTKLAGDKIALQSNPDTIVLRTSWVYSTYGKNFVYTMLRLAEKLETIKVIYDQIGTPTYARDLADAILKIIPLIDNDKVNGNWRGIFHFSNEGVASWYDFAIATMDIMNVECKVLPITTAEYPTPAPRPHFSVLNKSLFKETFDIEIPHWRASLRAFKELAGL